MFPKFPADFASHVTSTKPTAIELSLGRGMMKLPCLAWIDQDLPAEYVGERWKPKQIRALPSGIRGEMAGG